MIVFWGEGIRFRSPGALDGQIDVQYIVDELMKSSWPLIASL